MNHLTEHLRNMLTADTLFRYYGLTLPNGDNKNISCPFPGIEDKRPSFNVKIIPPFLYKAFNGVENSKGKTGGDCFDFIAGMEGLDAVSDFKEILKIACDITNTDEKDFKKKTKAPKKQLLTVDPEKEADMKKRAKKIEYVWQEGRKKKSLVSVDVRSYCSQKHIKGVGATYGAFMTSEKEQRFGIAIKNEAGEVVGIQKSDKMLLSGSTTGFYYEDDVQFHGDVYFVEGMSDYLTMLDAGYKNTVGIHSTMVGGDRIMEMIRQVKTAHICFDRDSKNDFLGMRLAYKVWKACKTKVKLYLASQENDFDISDIKKKGARVSDVFAKSVDSGFFKEFLFPGSKVVSYQNAARRICDIYRIGLTDKQHWYCPRETGIWEQASDIEVIKGFVLEYINDYLDMEDHNPTLIDKLMKYVDIHAIKRRKGLASAFMRDKKYYSKMQNKLFLKEGMYNLKTGEVTPYQPDDYILSTLDISPGLPNQDCPRFKQFMNEIFEGEEDKKERIKFIQEWMGYCLYPHLPFHKILYILGEGGNGKSVLLNVIGNIVGRDNSVNLEVADLARNQFSTAALLGKYINLCSDAEKGTKLNAATLKKITGEDVITGEFKYKNAFEFVSFAKMVFAANNYPVGIENARWLFRRFQMIRLNNEFSERYNNLDPFLGNKLAAERNQIFWWAVEGLKSLLDRGGFDVPETVLSDTTNFIRESDKILKFCRRRVWATDTSENSNPAFTQMAKKDKWTLVELYSEYLVFCEEHRDRYPVNETNFREAMQSIHRDEKMGTIARLDEDSYLLSLSEKESPFKEEETSEAPGLKF